MDKLTETLKKLAKSAFYIVTAILLILLTWVLWRTYQADNFGFASKTFWDWMELLGVPFALAIVGYLLASSQKKAELAIAKEERATDREIALERQQQQTLENYLDRMKELILDRHLGPDATPEVKRLARTWTLNVLRELTAKRNRQVIQFLQEAELLGVDASVDLSKADLGGVALNGVNLNWVNLSEVNLSGADLSEANLSEADLSGADLSKATLVRTNLSEAILSRVNLSEANLSEVFLWETNLSNADLRKSNLSNATLMRTSLIGADLNEANLSNADLRNAKLGTANLSGTNLSGANLKGANLFWANLNETKVSEEQISQTTLSDKTIMPDGSTYLEWMQKREQEQSQVQSTEEVLAAGEAPKINEVKGRLAEPAPEDNQELVPSEVEETTSTSSE